MNERVPEAGNLMYRGKKKKSYYENKHISKKGESKIAHPFPFAKMRAKDNTFR